MSCERVFVIFAVLECFLIPRVMSGNVTAIRRFEAKNWIIMPDDKGFPHIVDTSDKQLNTKFFLQYFQPDAKITLWLYNKKFRNAPRRLKASGATDPINFSLDEAFDGSKKVKILIHGWKHDYKSAAVQVLKTAYLDEAEDINIIAVDWGEIASDQLYMLSVMATRNVGQNVAHVIEHMVNRHNVSLDDVHIIGHSLGAHAAGHIGMYLKTQMGRKLGRITGLDPAHPAFEDTTRSDNILDPTDAKFVDIIHTSAGVIGHTANLGHADFWPNNGRATQPGCDILSDFFGACSHGRSYRYFAESLQAKDGFPSLRCNSWEDYLASKCTGEAVVMGEAAPVTARGAYFLRTGAGPKFALTNKIK